MASKKEIQSIQDLCSNIAFLGNSIALCMVAYLHSAKREPIHFRHLAKEFLDTCTMIYAISAGLSDSAHPGLAFPSDLLNELAKKTGAIHTDFVLLLHKLNKFLDGDRKGVFRKFTSRMFADGDIDKLRQTFRKRRDELRISALMFRWSVGEHLLDSSTDPGYIALSTAIKYTGLPESSRSSVKNQSQQSPTTQSSSIPPAIPLPPPPGPLIDKPLAPIHSSRSSSEDTLDALVPSGQPIRTCSLRVKRQSGTGSPMRSSPAPPSSRDRVDSKTYVNSPSDLNFPIPPKGEDRIHDIDTMERSIHGVDTKEKALPAATDTANSDTSSCHSLRGYMEMCRVNEMPEFGNITPNVSTANNSLKMTIKLNKHRRIEHVLSQTNPASNGVDDNNLRIAISKRDLESLRLILQFGTDPNRADDQGFTPLHFATEVPCLKAAKLLLHHGANPALSPKDGIDSPIVMAIKESKFDFVQMFLRSGTKMSAIMGNGNALFIDAIKKETPLVFAELMLKAGANANGKNSRGVSPLNAAIEAGRPDLVSLLLDAGADPNVPGPEHPLWPSIHQPSTLQLLLAKGANHKKTPGILELATSVNNVESISILLAAGVNTNTKKDGIYTPLCTAIRDDRVDIIRMLLANGADPNLMASEYPAFKCVTHRREHLLPQLIAAGSDIHNPKGILVVAVAHGNRKALLWLLDHGVNPNDRYDEDGGHTALTRAIQDNKLEYVDIMLANGGSSTARGKDWPILMAVRHPAILSKLLEHTTDIKRIPKGAMEAAVAANELESVKLFLKAGVSVEDKTNGVFSPLTTALREHRYEIVKYLLDEAGADPNRVGEHLPLIKAIRRYENKDLRYIEILLENGADVNKMYRGWNAILQAVDLGDMDILELLIRKSSHPLDLDRVDEESGLTVMEMVKDRDWEEAVDVLYKAAHPPSTA